MQSIDYQTIEKAAARVLKDFGENSAPVNLQTIISGMNIIFSEVPSTDDDLSGLILRGKDKTIIGVNAGHSEQRKRFTTAHELGHYFLHKDGDTFVDRHSNLQIQFRKSSSPKTREETQANRFAAALLMPANQLKQHFKAMKDVTDDMGEIVDFLSKKYIVSFDAMKYRLLNLNLIDNC